MILSYETVKYVSIKDSRLGLLRYTFICGIIFYVGYIELYTYGKYLMNASIHGVIRFSLQQPTIDNCDPFNGNIPCQNDFRPIRDLAYCQQSSPSLKYVGNQYPCEYYEAINAQYITETSIVVLTRVKTMNQTLICGDHIDDTNNLDTCPHTYEATTETNTASNNNNDNMTQSPFYVAQSEAFTVLLDHAVSASKLCTNTDTVASMSSKPNDDLTYTCSSSSNQYNGRLYSTNIEMCQQYVSYPDITSHEPNLPNTTTIPCYIAPNVTNSNVDYFSVDVLLRAAGINAIDDCAIGLDTTNNNETSTCSTYRDTGATIIVNIVWNDFLPHHGLVEPYYYYRVNVMNKSYKMSIPYYHTYRYSRTLLIGHGIRIGVVISGEFHQFDYMTLFMTITMALGLLTVATTVVDYFMIYVLPEKEKYIKAKYEAANEVVVEIANPVPQLFSPSNETRYDLSSLQEEMNVLSSPVALTFDDESNLNEPLLQRNSS